MTFAAEKSKQASERFVLVRVEPTRDLTAGLSSIGGGVYSVALGFKPRVVGQSGSIFSEASLPLSSNGTYGWDGETFFIKTATAPNYTNGVVYCTYWILVTDKNDLYFNPDPDTLLLPAELWESRLPSPPEINVSIENLRSGNITISGSSVDIISSDGFFESRLTENDSYYNKPVTIWQCINSTSNIQKIFTGKTASASISGGVASLAVLDDFNTLNQPCYMGDRAGEVVLNTADYPNVDPKQIGSAIPYLICDYTPHDFDSIQQATLSYSVSAKDLSVFYKAKCTSYSKTISTSDNRSWVLCRSESFLKQSFGTINSVLGTATQDIRVNFSSYSNLFVGQPVSWVESSVTYYGHISHVGLVSGYNVRIRVEGPNALISTSSVFNLNYCLTILIKTADASSSTPENAGVTGVLYEGRDYYVSEGVTSGGNKVLSITFQTSMETNVNNYLDFKSTGVFANRALNPDFDEVYFYVHTTTDLNHSDVVKKIVEKAGLTCDATTFSTAKTDLSLDCKFSIPHYGDTTLGSYADYLQDLLFCTVGYLSIGVDGEIEYYLLRKPDPSTTLEADRIDNSTFFSLSQTVDYQDIYFVIRGKNNMLADNQLTALVGQPSTLNKDSQGYNNLAFYVHGVTRQLDFRDVTTDISQTLDYIVDLSVSPVSRYTLSTSTKTLGEQIGRDFYLVRGNSTPVKVKVLSSSSGKSSSTVVLDDVSKLSRV